MAPEMKTVDLVRRAIAEPLMIIRGLQDEQQLRFPESLERWARLLAERYPLWAFRPHAYATLNEPDMPMTHPLGLIVRSIARDEGLLELTERHPPIEDLVRVIDNRRCSLVLDDCPSWSVAYADGTGEGFPIFNAQASLRFPAITEGPILAHYEPDSEYTIGGYISPYEEIGVELIRHLEARQGAKPRTKERTAADRALNQFLARLAGRVPGYPTIIRNGAAEKLVSQGSELMDLLWEALGSDLDLGSGPRAALASYVAEDDVEAWAIRLAIPIFSARELRALRGAIDDSKRFPPDAIPPAERFTLEVLAHRLRIPCGTLARKVMHGWKAEALDFGEKCAVCGYIHRP